MKTTTPCRAIPRSGIVSIALPILVAVMLHGTPVLGVSLGVVSQSKVQQSGDTARVCVTLNSAGEQVVATQNELSWDASCASLVDQCEANPAHGKQLMPNQKSTNVFRAIIISLSNTKPIPDGDLYCCTFRVNLDSPGACCQISNGDLGSSDPEGKALSTAGSGGQVCLASGSGSSGGLQGGTGGAPQAPVSADLGTGGQQAPAAGQPAAQQAVPKAAAGGGNTVAGGGVGGVPGGIGGVPGGQPRAQGQPDVQPGEVAQPQAAAPGAAPVPGTDAARPQAPAGEAASQQMHGVPGTPTVAPAAVKAPEARAPAAPAAPAREGASAVKPAAPANKTAVAKSAAPAPAPAAQSSGCNCEITTSGAGFEGSGALVGLGLLLWARRRKL